MPSDERLTIDDLPGMLDYEIVAHISALHDRAGKAEEERDGLAALVAEIRASLKDDHALCASIRGALMAVHDAHPDVPTSHRAAKRVVGAIVNVLDNLILRHVEHEAGHDIKTLCREILKLRHGGKPGTDLDRGSPTSRSKAFVNLQKAHIRVKAELEASEAEVARYRERVSFGNHKRAQCEDNLERAEAERKRADRLEAEVTALREAGDELRACLQDALTAERSGGIRDAWYAHHERWDAALDDWRALEGPGEADRE